MNNSSFCSDQSEGVFTRAALALLLAPLACAVVRQVKAELRDLDGGWLEGGKYCMKKFFSDKTSDKTKRKKLQCTSFLVVKIRQNLFSFQLIDVFMATQTVLTPSV